MPNNRNQMNRQNEAIVSAQLEQRITRGEISRSEIANWLTQPWSIYKFMKPEKKHEDRIFAALFSQAEMKGLEAWSIAAANKDPKKREAWEAAAGNIDMKEKIEEKVRIIHEYATKNLAVFEKTHEDLQSTRALNSVEGFLRGTKEYIWDDFSEHPEMSAGLVIAAYMGYKMIKNTNAWSVIKWGAAITVGGAFLKDKLGVQPVEKIAELLEGFGWKKGADMLRKGSATLEKGVGVNQHESTINGYYYEKLGFDRNEEQFAFNHILEKNPKKLVGWYDKAKKWVASSRSATDVPPGEVGDLFYEMEESMDLPSWFSDMPEREKLTLFVNVFERMLVHIAENNREDTTLPTNADAGLAILQAKYITGAYFDTLKKSYAEREAELLEDPRFADPFHQEKITKIFAEAAYLCDGMKRRVQCGCTALKFYHIMYVEGDPKLIGEYTGMGMTLGEMNAEMEKALEDLKDLGGDGYNMAVAYLSGLPQAFDDLWKRDLKPIFEAGKAAMAPHIKTFADWYIADVEPLIVDAYAAGRDFVVLTIPDSAPVQLLKQIGLSAGEAIKISLAKAEEIAKYLKEWREMGEALATFSSKKVTAGVEISLGDVDHPVLQGYLHTVSGMAVIEPIATGGIAKPALILPKITFTPPPPALNGVIANRVIYPIPIPGFTIPAGYKIVAVEIEMEVQNAARSITRKSSKIKFGI